MRGYPNQWFQNTGGTSMGGSTPPPPKNSTGQNRSKISDWRQNMQFSLPMKVHSNTPRSPRGLRALWTPNPPPSLRQIPIFETRAIEWRQEQTALIWYAGLNAALAVTCRVSLSNSGSESSGIKTPTKYRFRCQIECFK